MDSYILRSVSDLPPIFRSTFKFRYFNSLQSECFSLCYLSDINSIVSAPTGSGKTVLFELCILRVLSRFLTKEGQFNHVKGTLKTVYIAPSKALVQEKFRDWSQKFSSSGISCLELTGDNESYNVRNLQEADIILTTPEKFDAVTRQHIWDGGLGFFCDISLVLIDEVHLLSDTRGSVLEAIVCRLKMLARNPSMKSSSVAHVRLVAVSATIPNIEDLAEWLMVPAEGIKRFGEEMRPVKLTTKVFGYAPAKNDFLFEQRLQNFIFDILMQHSRGKSALIFCSTRKGAQDAAQRLRQSAINLAFSNPFIKSQEQQERLKSAALSFSDKHMQMCIPFGVGYHNGGLCQKDRNLIEGLFLKGDLQILCTTNTLAHGINLPAHTVIIKSTQYFNKEKGLYMEYDRSTILQMSGRAGRPPFDDSGLVIIMTRRETVHLYKNLLSGCETVESQMLSCMTEHLNAEIVQLTVSDISLAIEWLKCSYLYIRIKRKPENYGVLKGVPSEQLEKHIKELCVKQVNELAQYGMVWTDEYGFLLKPLEPGKLMTKYYLKFATTKEILLAPAKCTLAELLYVICRCDEISWIQLRRNEKRLLNDINFDKDGRLRFHIESANGKRKKRIQTREEKNFVLANDCLTGDPMIHDLSLSQDVNAICSSGTRIAKCMKECFIFRKVYAGAVHASLLAKCLHHRLWNDSPYLLKQLVGIGLVTAKALHSMGIDSFETLESADPRRIEIITGRKYPFGNQIKESLLSIPPKIELKIEEAESKRQGDAKLNVTIRTSSSSCLPAKIYADLIVGTEEDNQIVYHEKIRLNECSSPYTVTVFVALPQNDKLSVSAHLITEEYVGRDVCEKFVVTRKKVSGSKQKQAKDTTAIYSASKETDMVECCSSRVCHPAAELLEEMGQPIDLSSMPSFDLLQADADNDPQHETDEVMEIDDPEDESFKEEKIFEHIRKKAKTLVPFETFLTMNRGHQVPQRQPHTIGQKMGDSNSDEHRTQTIVLSDSESKDFTDVSCISVNTHMDDCTFDWKKDCSFHLTMHSIGETVSSTAEGTDGFLQPAPEEQSGPLSHKKNSGEFPPKSNGKFGDRQVESYVRLDGDGEQMPCAMAVASPFDVSFLGCRSVFSFL